MYIWEDTTDIQNSGKRRLVANGNYLHHHSNDPNTPLDVGWGKEPDANIRLEVKGGERQPQGVIQEGQRSDSEPSDPEAIGAKARERAMEYCNHPRKTSGGEEGKETVTIETVTLETVKFYRNCNYRNGNYRNCTAVYSSSNSLLGSYYSKVHFHDNQISDK